MTLDQWFSTQPHGSGHKVAQDLGIHYTWVSSLRRGKKHPSPELAKRIEDYTGGAVTQLEMATAVPTKKMAKQMVKPKHTPTRTVIRGHFPGVYA